MSIRCAWLFAGAFLLAAMLHAPLSRAADGQPAVEQGNALSAFIEAVGDIHQQRQILLANDALPARGPLTGRIQDILPLAIGTPLERSTEFLTRMGRHGLAVDIDLSHRIEALMQPWLIAPPTLVSAQSTAKALGVVDQLEVVFADAVATELVFRTHLRNHLQAIWEGDPSRQEFMVGFSKGRGKIQPIVDELAANRRRLATSFRNILLFADNKRDHLHWDEASGQLIVDTDEDVVLYNRLVDTLQKVAAQEDAIVAMLMAEMSETVKSIQQ